MAKELILELEQKEPIPEADGWKKNLKAFLFYFVQWTWGLPVNIIGWIAFIICTKVKGYRWQHFGYAKIVYMPWNAGGLSMGLFIFIKDQHKSKKWTHDVRIHEYGHTWQCLLLGPLYYIVIAIPSVIWCNCFAGYRKKHNIAYGKLYCEGWANAWGRKFTGMDQFDRDR